MHLAQMHHIGICIFKHSEFYWKLNQNICADLRPLTAGVPGQVGEGAEACEQVEECPGDDDAVVDVEVEHHGHGGHPHPLQHRAQLRHERHAARTQVLAHRNLLEEDRDPAEGHRDEVDDQECS